MANWPTLPDDPTSLPDLSDGPPNLATAEAVANIPRRFLRKASLWLGNLTRGGGIGDGMCVAQDVPNLTVKVAAIDSFYSLASPAIALTKTSGAPFTSPAATAPATNPYIGLLTVDSAGALAWNYGAEAATPVRPAIPANKWPLWYAYLRPGSTAIRDTDSGSGGYLNGPGGAGDARYGKVAPFGGAAGSGYATIQDEGTGLTARTVLNFAGAGVTAADDGGTRTTVTIPGAAAGAMTLINDQTLGSAQASIVVPSIPGTYKSLRVEIQARGATASTLISLLMRMNADTGSNYDYVFFDNGGASSVVGASLFAGTSLTISDLCAASSPAGSATLVVVEIFNYAGTTFHKQCLSRGGTRYNTSSGIQAYASGNWRNTAAITSLTFLASTGNLDTGTRVTTWGLS